jgi:hypothetical protein
MNTILIIYLSCNNISLYISKILILIYGEGPRLIDWPPAPENSGPALLDPYPLPSSVNYRDGSNWYSNLLGGLQYSAMVL